MQRLEEACRILTALWTEPRATVEGVYYQVREAYHEPKPVQRPHPPLVIGTSGERVGLRIAARYAQTWNMARAAPEEFGKKSALLDQYCREIGRDPAEIERSIQFLPDAMKGDVVTLGREFIDAGATHLIYSCPTPYSAAGARFVWDSIVARLRA
jgi:alkanesulfonate monooxygenase SsuD/methylene tetrahydromethanopterin reductase-like flavin-dependent oxidoreductase (luciferase family)